MVLTMLVDVVINEPVIIVDGYVTIHLPQYELVIKQKVKRSTGGGAAYAKEWGYLPENLKQIIAVWMSDNELCFKPQQKRILRAAFAKLSLHINEDPMNARISELLGLGLIYIAEPELKESNMITSHAPHYCLNFERIKEVTANDGKL